MEGRAGEDTAHCLFLGRWLGKYREGLGLRLVGVDECGDKIAEADYLRD